MSIYKKYYYTYRVFCKPENKSYYGVRTSHVPPEEDLWIRYRTSSIVVKHLRRKYGNDAFDYEVRRTFDTMEAAAEWECRVLARLKVTENPKWLNQHIVRFCFPHERNPELRRLVAERLKGSIWINNAGVNKRIKSHELPEFEANGWGVGRTRWKYPHKELKPKKETSTTKVAKASVAIEYVPTHDKFGRSETHRKSISTKAAMNAMPTNRSGNRKGKSNKHQSVTNGSHVWPNITVASKSTQLHRDTIRNRIYSDKFPNWKFV